MQKKKDIKRYTAEELKKMQAGSQSDWEAASAMTYDQIEAAIASDPDEMSMSIDWDAAEPRLPEPKAVLHMRIDQDVLKFFKTEGRGYQTKINAVLRSYVNAQQPK